MKKPLISILLSLLCLLFIFVSCDTATTPPVTSDRTEPTAEPSEEVTSEEITFEEVTSEAETTEEETTEEETTKNEETTAKETAEEELLIVGVHSYNDADFFDYRMTHMPTEAEMQQIKVGMSFEEILSIAGKPHCLQGSGYQFMCWYSEEGYRYDLSFSSSAPGGADDEDFNDEDEEEHGTIIFAYQSLFDYYRHMVIINEPYRFKVQKPISFMSAIAVMLESPSAKVLPSYAEMQSITVGMSFEEVTALVGKPQRYDKLSFFTDTESFSLVSFYIYYTSDDIPVAIRYTGKNDGTENRYVSYIQPLGDPPKTSP